MTTITFVQEVDIQESEKDADGLSEGFAYYCYFCEKMVKTTSSYNRVCEKLVRSKNFYCPFCVRNKFYTKNRWNILQLSFRGIISYIYYKYYRTKNRKIYLSEIKDMIEAHEKVGLYNPLFRYDPDTFIWFVDFSLVGKDKRKIEVEEVEKTVINILTCFNLNEIIMGMMSDKLLDKYTEAIQLFYSNRQRPDGKRLLVPTLSGCGGTAEQNFDYDKCRNFLPKNLIIR